MTTRINSGLLVAIRRTILCAAIVPVMMAPANTLAADLEQTDLKFGFIKLTDMAPLAVAKEKGFFEEEGLDVTLEAQSNWKVVLDRVVSGEIDGSHMLPPAILGASAGLGTAAELVTPFAMGLNTLAVTVSNEVWEQMKPNVAQEGGRSKHPIGAEAMKPVVEAFKGDGKKFQMAMTFPNGSHNVMLRYWLAAGGINPGFYTATDKTGQSDAEVLLSVTPPPQMPATLESGTINGFCVGEPWNQQVIIRGIGVPVTTADQVWSRLPEKAFGMRKEFVDANPNTTVAIVKALIKAGQWIDKPENKDELVEILSMSQYVGADVEVIKGPLTGTYEYEKGDKRPVPDMNLYHTNFASYPFVSDAVWNLTQLRRWGLVSEVKPDAWYLEVAKKTYRPDIYMQAAKALIAEGKAQAGDFPADGVEAAPASTFIDGKSFDYKAPNAYIDSLTIGLKSK